MEQISMDAAQHRARPARTTLPAHRSQVATARLATNVATLEDRHQIVDALYRFGAGQDLRDPALLASVFAPDAELDFVQPARKMGADVPVFKGREQIVSSIRAALKQLNTTHTVTNCRVETDGGDLASLFALVEAQHVSSREPGRHLLLKNFYWLRLERAGRRWVIKRMQIENVWHSGDPRVLFP